MARSRSERGAIAFMIVWLVFWLAGILIVLWGMVGALKQGSLGAMAFTAIWLAAAGFGLWSGTRKLRQLLRGAPAGRVPRDHTWSDGIGGRGEP